MTAFRRLPTPLLCLGLFVLALVPRVLDLGRPITWDEPMWVNRSLRFGAALQSGHLAKTFLVGHPGVSTMWLTSLGLGALCRFAPAACTGVPQLAGGTSGVYESEEALKHLATVLPAARFPIALAISLAVVGLYLLARRFVAPRTALAGAAIAAIDPFFIAHSRVVQLDGLTATFATLALFALLASLANESRRMLALSGVCAGLAVMSKSSALFLVPFTGLVLMIGAAMKVITAPGGRPRRAAVWRALAKFITWTAAAAATAWLIWPALWVNAPATIRQVLAMGVGYAQAPHENGNYFLGQPVDVPGPAFYPVAVLFRLTPLSSLGLVALGLAGLLVAGTLLRRRSAMGANSAGTERGAVSAFGRMTMTRQAWAVAAMLAYIVLFGVFMTIGAKKFDRYLLAVFPVLDVLAAVGLVWSVDRAAAWLVAHRSDGAGSRSPLAIMPAIALVLAVAAQAVVAFSYAPEYLAYYNPLAGGGPAAAKTLLVGWGEGMDQVADYLNAQSGATDMTTVAWVRPGFTPLFRGHTMDFLAFDSMAEPDYVVFYVSDMQRQLHSSAHAVFDQLQPEHVVRLHGVDYALIYRNDHPQVIADYLAAHAQPGDEILISQPSVLQRRYQGLLSVATAAPVSVSAPSTASTPTSTTSAPGSEGANEDGGALRAQLAALADRHRRVWFVDYGGGCDSGALQRYTVATAGEAFDRHDIRPYGVSLVGVDLTPPMSTDPQSTVGARPTASTPITNAPNMAALTLAPPTSAMTSAVGTTFGDRLRLQDLALAPTSVASGQAVGVALSWRAMTGDLPPLATKLLLRDSFDQVVTSAEAEVVDRDCRTTPQWEPGTVDQEWPLLVVPPGTPPGTYHLTLTVYELVGQVALPVVVGHESGGSELALGTVEVKRPASPPDLADLDIEHPAQGAAMAGIRLLGSRLSDLPLAPGDVRQLTLFWQADQDIHQDLDLRVQWQDLAGRTWQEARLSNASYSTSRWQAGDVVRAVYELSLGGAVPGGPAVVRVDLAAADGGAVLPGPGIVLATLEVRLPERRFEVPADISHLQAARLGEGVGLLGYDLAPAAVAPGGALTLTLFWQAQASMDRNYTVFVHLLDGADHVAGQADSPPLAGTRPTRGWASGEVLVDTYHIPVASDAAAGVYRVEVGMYDKASGARLPVVDGGGNGVAERRVVLGTAVTVARP